MSRLQKVGMGALGVSLLVLMASFYSPTEDAVKVPSTLATTSELESKIVVPPEMTSAASVAALAKYLEDNGPDEWHKIASGWNWDAGVEPLDWIIRQPQCDQATALLIYWKGGPGFLAQYGSRHEVPSHALANYDLVKEVERRYVAGFYTRHEIAFDPRKHSGLDWTQEYPDVKKAIPIPEKMHELKLGKGLPEFCVFAHARLQC